MNTLERYVEGKNISYIVPLGKFIDQHQLYMDATSVVLDAIDRDVVLGYDKQQGPNYGIEHHRLMDYINYVQEFINGDNYFKFDTKNYSFFLGSMRKS